MSNFIANLMERQLKIGIALGREESILLGRGEGIVVGRQEGVAIGRQQGLDEGFEQGVQQEKQAIARRMSELGFTLDQIAKVVRTDQAVVESWIAGN